MDLRVFIRTGLNFYKCLFCSKILLPLHLDRIINMLIKLKILGVESECRRHVRAIHLLDSPFYF